MQFTEQQFPGSNRQTIYSERLEVGYRWYHAHDISAKYPFGHGLSYTTFAFQDLSIDERTISFSVTNTGSRIGFVVPQLYLTYPTLAQEPPRQLKNFSKMQLQPGENRVVRFVIEKADVSIWDIDVHAFVVQQGIYEVEIGESSQNIQLRGVVHV